MKSRKLSSQGISLQFDKFWTWLTGHANCLLRAGTPEVMLLDNDDFHWQLRQEDEHSFVVQLCRAKDVVAEMLVFPAEVAYVQVEAGEHEDEFLFECVVENEHAREVAYHFVLSHDYDGAEHSREEKWTH